MFKKLTPGYWVNFVLAAICLGAAIGLAWYFLIGDSPRPAPETVEVQTPASEMHGDPASKQPPSEPVAGDGPETIFDILWSEYRPSQSELVLSLLTGQETSHCQASLTTNSGQIGNQTPLIFATAKTASQTGCLLSMPVTDVTEPILAQSSTILVTALDDGTERARCLFTAESVARPQPTASPRDVTWGSNQAGCWGNDSI